MPLAIKMQEQYGDDVQFLFIESQGASEADMEKFVLQKKWISDNAIWTTEAPFQTGASGIPHCVVLGINGEVLINDNPLSAHSKIEEALTEQLKLAKKGEKEWPAPVSKAWQDFDKGNFAAAMKALEAVPEGPDKDVADKVANKLALRAKASINRLQWLIEAAEFDRADKLSAQLTKALAGNDLSEKVKTLADQLASKEMAPERDAAKALDRVEKKIAKDGLDDQAVKQLKSVGEKFAQTRAGKRAAHMASLAGS